MTLLMKIVIFGASGDLAKRKLFPALSKIDTKDTEIIAFARTSYDKPFSEVLKNFYTYEDESFCDKILYVQGKSYTDLEALGPHLNSETYFYFSLPPEVYHDTITVLEDNEYKAVAVEKPFGADYEGFLLFKKFTIEKLYFIDHFLLKPLIVSWPNLVAKSDKLKKILCNKHVKIIEVLFKEEIGGEGRGYFDTHGLVKDIVQNHISEMVAITAAEPNLYSCERQADERVHIFQNTKVVEKDSCFGQYSEYIHEMKKPSNTETFAIVTLSVNTERWKGVPFITISGKGLNEKRTEIVYEFKEDSYQTALNLVEGTNYERVHKDLIKNFKLICNLYPRNEVYLRIELEERTFEHLIVKKEEIDRLMNEKYGKYENHEIVFNSFINETPLDCVRYSEAELLWKIYDCLLKKDKPLFYYSKGVEIPREAEEMLENIKYRY
jgi:glucose-6-phosphate 1-dehydrogenase